MGGAYHLHKMPREHSSLPAHRPPWQPPDGKILYLYTHTHLLIHIVAATATATALLLREETNLMVKKATASAQRHGISLRRGSPNPGTGDCAFEAVLHNNNDRSCFREKYPMTVDWYRRIWVKDMANRTRNSDHNIYSDEQWDAGWAEMLEPGIYERGIFGDLMIPGIACGIKKILLIFNTNLNSPHTPIYVIDPSKFNVHPDTETPIVLAYNMSHYESMEPCTEMDIAATINLVRDYKEGRYGYTRNDLPSLLGLAETDTVDAEDITDEVEGVETETVEAGNSAAEAETTDEAPSVVADGLEISHVNGRCKQNTRSQSDKQDEMFIEPSTSKESRSAYPTKVKSPSAPKKEKTHDMARVQAEMLGNKSYHLTLMDSLSEEVSGSLLNCFIIGSCGRKVGIPTFLLCHVWSEFRSIISTLNCCESSSQISVIFQDVRFETLQVFKDFLMYGTVENPDESVENEFYDLMEALHLNFEIEKEFIDCDDFENISEENSESNDEGEESASSFQSQQFVNAVNSQEFEITDCADFENISEENSESNDEGEESASSFQSQQFVNAVSSKQFENVGHFLSKSSKASSEFCSQSCCNRCAQTIDSWGVNEHEEVKKKFEANNAKHLRQLLMDQLKAQEAMGISTSNFSVRGQAFCSSFFANLIGKSNYLIRKTLKNFNRGFETVSHGNEGVVKYIPSTVQATCWIKNFAEAYGQHSPEQNVMVLNHWLNKGALFSMYKADTVDSPVSQSLFYKLFKTVFGHKREDKTLPCVRISKYSTHSECNECVALNNFHRKCKSESAIDSAKSLKNDHRIEFGQARRKVNEIRESAERFPEEHIFVQIDGMDNNKSYLPRYLHKSKDQQQKERIPTKITGCIINSGWYAAKRKCIFYLNHDQYEQGSNLIVSIVFRLLQVFVRDHSKLPKKLHLNMGRSFKLVISLVNLVFPLVKY